MSFYSVTVAYNPNENLREQIQFLISVGIKPIVVFNSEYTGQLDQIKGIQIFKNDKNEGLAKAINIGVSLLLAKDAEGFFLFDQDSTPEIDMIQNLLEAKRKLSDEKINIGSIGPMIWNESDHSIWPIPITESGQIKFINKIDQDIVEVDFLITSGIYIPLNAWKEVGGYREDYFIDGLDIEWGYRAKSLGYKNFVCAKAKLHHHLGDKSIPIFPFLKKRMIVHSSIRRFYMFRNFLWMCRLSHIPTQFKLHYGRKLFKMLVGISLSPSQWDSIPHILNAFWKGIFIHKNSIAKATENR